MDVTVGPLDMDRDEQNWAARSRHKMWEGGCGDFVHGAVWIDCHMDDHIKVVCVSEQWGVGAGAEVQY